MTKIYKIGIIPGEGIGKDVINATMHVLNTVKNMENDFNIEFSHMDAGEDAVQKFGNPFPEETRRGIKDTDAVLFGAAGNPHTVEVLRGFRRGFKLYAKVCPIKAFPYTNALKPDADFLIVRENSEGLFRGVGYIDRDHHVNLRIFTKQGMERIIRFCFELAQKTKHKKVTFTHKAHVLKYTDKPMKQIFTEIATEYPDIEAEDMTIDACAMQIVMHPERFGIILAESSNGDILSDVGAGIMGGLGFACSGNIGNKMAVFEPIHGTAPKYAGKDIVNPIAAIMASVMMFEHLGESIIASKIQKSVSDVLLEKQTRTYDIGGDNSTTEMAMAISKKLAN